MGAGAAGLVAIVVVLAAGAGLLAGAEPIALVGLAGVLGAAFVFWRFPYMALLGILVIRVAVPNFELPNAVIAIGGVLGLLLGAAALPPRRIMVPLVGFALLALVTMPWGPTIEVDPAAEWLLIPGVELPYFPRAWVPARELGRLLSVVVVLWLAYAVTTDGRRLESVVAAVLASSGIAVAVGLVQFVRDETVDRTGLPGITGPFGHPSHFGHYLVVVLAVGVVAVMRSKPGPVQLGTIGLVLASGAALYLTYSRTAWLAFALVLAALVLVEYRRILIVLAIALPLAFVVAPGAFETARERFADVSEESGSYSSSSWSWRVDHWQTMLPYGLRDPLGGSGYGTYHSVTVAEYGLEPENGWSNELPTGSPGAGDRVLGVNAHNDYLKAFVENGVAGVALWCAVFLGAASALWSARHSAAVRPYAVALTSLVIGLMLISAGDNLRDNTVALVYAAAMIGAVLGAARRLRPAPTHHPLEYHRAPAAASDTRGIE